MAEHGVYRRTVDGRWVAVVYGFRVPGEARRVRKVIYGPSKEAVIRARAELFDKPDALLADFRKHLQGTKTRVGIEAMIDDLPGILLRLSLLDAEVARLRAKLGELESGHQG